MFIVTLLCVCVCVCVPWFTNISSFLDLCVCLNTSIVKCVFDCCECAQLEFGFIALNYLVVVVLCLL